MTKAIDHIDRLLAYDPLNSPHVKPEIALRLHEAAARKNEHAARLQEHASKFLDEVIAIIGTGKKVTSEWSSSDGTTGFDCLVTFPVHGGEHKVEIRISTRDVTCCKFTILTREIVANYFTYRLENRREFRDFIMRCESCPSVDIPVRSQFKKSFWRPWIDPSEQYAKARAAAVCRVADAVVGIYEQRGFEFGQNDA